MKKEIYMNLNAFYCYSGCFLLEQSWFCTCKDIEQYIKKSCKKKEQGILAMILNQLTNSNLCE